jgi:PhnB protein
MKVQPYLDFDGRAEEALQFYASAAGAKIGMVMRFRDNPEPPGGVPMPNGDKILHSEFTLGETTLMASDGHCSGQNGFKGIMLAISVADEAQAKQVFGGLSDGGQVTMPLSRTFFSPSFGMLTDRFGVQWMVLVSAASPA